jgi:hypothetical protein
MIVDKLWTLGLKHIFTKDVYPHIVRLPYYLGAGTDERGGIQSIQKIPFITNTKGALISDGFYPIYDDLIFYNTFKSHVKGTPYSPILVLQTVEKELLQQYNLPLIRNRQPGEYSLTCTMIFPETVGNSDQLFLQGHAVPLHARFVDEHLSFLGITFDTSFYTGYRNFCQTLIKTLNQDILKNEVGQWDLQNFNDHFDRKFSPEVIRQISHSILYDAILCLTLLSTKNIVQVPQIPAPALQKARKRRKQLPLFTWHELMLQTKKGSSGKGTETLEPLAQHWVRGHFKTYTKENPLFGRLTGRYWWSPHLAGKDTERFVDKTYVVK